MSREGERIRVAGIEQFNVFEMIKDLELETKHEFICTLTQGMYYPILWLFTKECKCKYCTSKRK